MEFREKVKNKIEGHLEDYEIELSETPWYQNTAPCQLKGAINEMNSLKQEFDGHKGFTSAEVGCYLGGRISALKKLKEELIFEKTKRDELDNSKVMIDDIIGLVKTDEPTNSVELKKLYGDNIPVQNDKMLQISEGLLEDIRHELVAITGLKAVDMFMGESETAVIIAKEDIIELDYENLIEKIDKVLSYDG